MKEQKPIFGSGKHFYEMTYFKHFAFVGISYLVLRELPIKNFYARSVIWGLIGFKVMNNYKLNFEAGGIQTNFVMNTPAHFLNRYKIFEYARRSIDDVPAEKQGGVSAYDKWKLA
jgi:hypothetical protein